MVARVKVPQSKAAAAVPAARMRRPPEAEGLQRQLDRDQISLVVHGAHSIRQQMLNTVVQGGYSTMNPMIPETPPGYGDTRLIERAEGSCRQSLFGGRS